MKPFRFRLARLLQLKLAEKKQRAIELAHEQQALRVREAELEDSHAQHAKVGCSYAALSTRATRASEWEGAVLALGAAELEISRRVGRVRQASDLVDQARERLVQKAREAETLDRLRQRRWREHVLEDLRAEQKENDAKAVTQFIRDRDLPGSSGRAS